MSEALKRLKYLISHHESHQPSDLDLIWFKEHMSVGKHTIVGIMTLFLLTACGPNPAEKCHADGGTWRDIPPRCEYMVKPE